MFGIIADFIASITSILLPCYLSYKSLRSADPAQTTPWLIYFIMLSLALLFESWTVFVLGWMPFYSWIRLFFLLYLVLPQTQGAKHLYLVYFEPYIVHHENQIDEFIGQAHQRLQQLGLGYMSVVVEYIRDKVLGQASPQQPSAASTGTGAAGYAAVGGYAQDLLSRFAMPAARTSAAQSVANSSGGAAGMFSMLSGVAGAALGASAAGTSRGMPTSSEASSIPDTFIPSSMANMSEREKSVFISTQRDRLSAMLKALDKEQQSLDLAYGSGPSANKRPGSSGSGLGVGLGSKSRSEQSFDNIDYEDIPSASSNSGSGYPSQHSTPPRPVMADHGQGRRTTSGSWVPGAVTGWFGGNTGEERRSPRGDRIDEDAGDAVSKGWNAAKDITESIIGSSQGRSSGYDRQGR